MPCDYHDSPNPHARCRGCPRVRGCNVGSMSVTVSVGDVAVTGTMTGPWDGEAFTALSHRCVAAIVDALEVLSLAVPRMPESP